MLLDVFLQPSVHADTFTSPRVSAKPYFNVSIAQLRVEPFCEIRPSKHQMRKNWNSHKCLASSEIFLSFSAWRLSQLFTSCWVFSFWLGFPILRAQSWCFSTKSPLKPPLREKHIIEGHFLTSNHVSTYVMHPNRLTRLGPADAQE